MTGPGTRGERAGEGRFLAPLAIVAVVLVTLAVGVTAAILPHRVERPLSGTLRAVRIWNALETRCQLENDVASPLPYTCGANVMTDVHRSASASTRRLLAVRSPHDNCVIDEETLEAVLCRDTMFEWVAIDGELVSAAVISLDGTHYEIAQRDLARAQTRSIDVPLTRWFDTSDPREVFVLDGQARARVTFGALVATP